jgi:hypothetical protein
MSRALSRTRADAKTSAARAKGAGPASASLPIVETAVFSPAGIFPQFRLCSAGLSRSAGFSSADSCKLAGFSGPAVFWLSAGFPIPAGLCAVELGPERRTRGYDTFFWHNCDFRPSLAHQLILCPAGNILGQTSTQTN